MADAVADKNDVNTKPAYKYKFIYNNVGQALVHVLALSFVIGGISTYVLNEVSIGQKNSRVPRIKSEMAQLEARFRSDLTYMTNFDCTLIGAAKDYSKCTLPATFYNAMKRTVRGCSASSAGTFCGAIIKEKDPVVYNAATNTLNVSAVLSYTGKETPIAARELLVKVPIEVLNTQPFQGACPANAPIFRGFDPSGNIICEALPPDCGPGEYLQQINPGQKGSAMYKCVSYAHTLDCGANLISSYSWGGGSSFPIGCSAPINPFSYFGFSPSVDTSGGAGSCSDCGSPIFPPPPSP